MATYELIDSATKKFKKTESKEQDISMKAIDDQLAYINKQLIKLQEEKDALLAEKAECEAML
jgi:hypothetical protein